MLHHKWLFNPPLAAPPAILTAPISTQAPESRASDKHLTTILLIYACMHSSIIVSRVSH